MPATISEKNKCSQLAGIFLSAALLSAACILILYKTIPFIYDSVDDMATRDMLFGNYTGTSDGHLTWISYPLSWLLTLPFRLLPGFDWYGAFLIGLSWLCLTLTLARALEGGGTFGGKAFRAACCLLCFLAVWTRYLTVFIYTVTTALVGAATVFWFLTIDFGKSKKRIYMELAVTVLLALLTLCLRYEVFLMTAAMALVCFFFRMICYPKSRALLIKGLLLPLLAGTLITAAVNLYVYSLGDWNGYLEQESYQKLIFDYYGLPEYEANKEFYNGIGFGEEEYKALEINPLFIHDRLTTENIKKISMKARELDTRTVFEKSLHALKLTGFNQIWSALMPLNLIHGLLWLVAIFIILKKRDRQLGGFCLAAAIVYFLLWFYLSYQGRTPERVGISMHLLGMMTMAGLLEPYIRGKKLPKPFFALITAGLIGAAGMGIHDGVVTEKEFYGRVPQYRAIIDYCASHPDCFYVVDLIALTEYTEPYCFRTEPVANYIKAGSPAVFTPSAMEKVARYGSENFHEKFLDNSSMYVISAKEDGLDDIRRMYEKNYPDFSCRLVDVIRWGGNHSYVYQYSLNPDMPGPADTPSLVERLVSHETGSAAERAMDGDPNTCWSSGKPQEDGRAVFDIMLSETTQLRGIWLSVGDAYDDYPRSLKIFATPDGESWEELNTESTADIYFSFDAVPVKALRLIADEAPGVKSNWSIAEIRLYR